MAASTTPIEEAADGAATPASLDARLQFLPTILVTAMPIGYSLRPRVGDFAEGLTWAPEADA